MLSSDCGDGSLVGDEMCDDRNTISNDGCSSACRVEKDYICDPLPIGCRTFCGDGVRAGSVEWMPCVQTAVRSSRIPLSSRDGRVQPGDVLSFVPGALQLVRDGEIQVWPSSWPALVSPKMEVTVESPAGGFEKIQASLRAPAQVGQGGDILLDASRSTGPSRQFFYTVEALSLPIAWLDQVFVNEDKSSETRQRL